MAAEYETGTEIMNETIKRSSSSGKDSIGKYSVIGVLGKGGEGNVYLARDENLHRSVAVKQMCHPTERRQGKDSRIVQEAELLKELKHPMLPVVYELLWDKTWYLVMEYIQGISLREYIDRNGHVGEEQACVWSEMLLDVTEYLHNRKPPVIYRDFKPDNIMVCRDGQLRLVDFGAAVVRNYGVKKPSVMAATPGYAAPEQFGRGGSLRGHDPTDESAEAVAKQSVYADERSDIYALGKIMYYMVTGADPAKPPYTSLSIRDYQPLLSGRMERVIRRCIEEDPKRRYQMAEDVRKELMRYDRRKGQRCRRSFIRAVEKRVWLTEAQTDGVDGTVTNSIPFC